MNEDLQYIFETFSKDELISAYYNGDLRLKHIATFGRYFTTRVIRNGYHSMNGNTWATCCGILDQYYRSNTKASERDLSNKQAVYLITNIKDNIADIL